MLILETISKIRRGYFVQKKPIKVDLPGASGAKAIDYIIKRWEAFTLFLDNGRVCLSNKAAHPAHRLDELLPWNWAQAVSAITDGAA